jgi:DICT domain-containing protein
MVRDVEPKSSGREHGGQRRTAHGAGRKIPGGRDFERDGSASALGILVEPARLRRPFCMSKKTQLKRKMPSTFTTST